MRSRDIDYEKFGRRVRNRRIQLSMTQNDLARETMMTSSYIGHLEKGYRSPSVDALIALCNALQTTPTELLQDYLNSTEDVLVKADFDQNDLKTVLKVAQFIRETGNLYKR